MKKIIGLVVVISLFIAPVAFADSTVTATAGIGSSVSPSGVTVVPTGVDQTFDIGAESGYVLSGVTLDGISQPLGNVDFTGIAGDLVDHVLTVSSSIVAPTGGAEPFCSSPSAPGWNVGLVGGGCGGSQIFTQYNHVLPTGGMCEFSQGCLN